MGKINYQLKTDEQIKSITESGKRPSLLLHSCCGPCSSYVIEYLSKYFDITVYYYNPNVYPESEYMLRLSEQKRLVKEIETDGKLAMLDTKYDPEHFEAAVKGLEDEREGGTRCSKCFTLRFDSTARKAKEMGFDYFTTTLSVSPHKNSAILNFIGEEMEKKYGVRYLYGDFKKREGYKRSIELSEKHDLYRQNYCGCKYSLENR